MNKPLVSIHTITYNHAPYIRQCIEGSLMQKTNFPFEIVIGEDCSTDGTAEIVFDYARKFPEIIRVITSEENVGAKNNSIRTSKACSGKYIAFCEGDDYWTDPYKLQKQVDFLESHPDYGLVHTDFDVYYEVAKRKVLKENRDRNIPIGEVFEKLVLINFISTLTVCATSDLFLSALNVLKNHTNWVMGDYPLWLEISKNSKIGYINQSTAVRRLLPESASQSKDKDKAVRFLLSEFEIRKYFIEKYKLKSEIILETNEQNNKIVLEKAFKDHNGKLLKLYNKDNQNEASFIDRLYYWGAKHILIWLSLRALLHLFPQLRISTVKILNGK